MLSPRKIVMLHLNPVAAKVDIENSMSVFCITDIIATYMIKMLKIKCDEKANAKNRVRCVCTGGIKQVSSRIVFLCAKYAATQKDAVSIPTP